MTAEAGRRGIRVMIAMPVLAPCSHLKRTQPPDVLTGIHAIGKAGLQVQQTIDEGLHVKAVDETDCSEPEESSPTEQEISERQ